MANVNRSLHSKTQPSFTYNSRRVDGLTWVTAWVGLALSQLPASRTAEQQHGRGENKIKKYAHN